MIIKHWTWQYRGLEGVARVAVDARQLGLCALELRLARGQLGARRVGGVRVCRVDSARLEARELERGRVVVALGAQCVDGLRRANGGGGRYGETKKDERGVRDNEATRR